MIKPSLQDRCDLYRAAFPKFQPLSVVDTADKKQRIEGLWIMGNDYRVKSGYYGGYPAGYLPRILSLFPDCERGLHIFSGRIEACNGFDTLDSNPENKPSLVGDAEAFSAGVIDPYDIILADPPYSAEDAEHYGTTMISRKKVFDQCFHALALGGWLVWLDQVFPMFSKKRWHLGLCIGMIKSTNHRTRAVFGFQKVG